MSSAYAAKTNEQFYPINFKLKGKQVLVCGGNAPALAEVNRLVDFGAGVHIVSLHMVTELADLALTLGERVNLSRRAFNNTDATEIRKGKYALVFAYTNDVAENERIRQVAKETGVLVSVIDDIDATDFVVPSLIKRGHLKISISTDAISQALERAVVQKIEATFVSEIDSYTLFLTAMNELKQRAAKEPALSNPATFRQLMRNLAESEEIFLALQRKNFDEANHLAEVIAAEIRAEQNEQAAI